MDLEVMRLASNKNSTFGSMFVLGRKSLTAPIASPPREWRCMTVEDEYRAVKVPKETRIPAGTYKLALRTEGGMHVKYTGKYPWHRGMLWLLDVPNFQFVYIHAGNKETETDGCILVGNGVNKTESGEFELLGSVAAYERLYVEVATAMQRGESCTIKISDVA